MRFQSRQKVSKIHFHICAHYDGAWANETLFFLSQLKNTQKRSFSTALAILDTHQSICSCTTILFFYPFVWVESWVWKAWLTLLWAFGDTGVLCATCQRLNDGSQSTQLSLCESAWTVCAPVWVWVWLYIWMWLCVFLRSRVNYTGHDVKGRSLVGENTAEFTQQLPWRQHC